MKVIVSLVVACLLLAGCGGKPSWRSTLTADSQGAINLMNDPGLSASDATVFETTCEKGFGEVTKWQADAANFPSLPIVTTWNNDLAQISEAIYGCEEGDGEDAGLEFLADLRRVIAVNVSAKVGLDSVS